MIGKKIKDCELLTSPTGNELLPCSDGSGKAKVVKFSQISTTTQAIGKANAATSECREVIAAAEAKLTQMNSAVSSATAQLQSVSNATTAANSAASSATSAASSATSAASSAQTAATNANKAAGDCSTAISRVASLVSQMSTLQSRVEDIETNDEEQDSTITELAELTNQLSGQAVTFAMGTALPGAVTPKQIFFVQATGKLYIGVPSYLTKSYKVVLNWTQNTILLNIVFYFYGPDNVKRNYGIVTEEGGLVKHCTPDGIQTGRYYKAGSGSIEVIGDESIANVRATTIQTTTQAQWIQLK